MFNTRASLDTNIVLRLILKDIPDQYEQALELLHRPGVEYNVSDLAITEVVYVLQSQGKTRTQIIKALWGFLKPMNINANFNLFNQVFPMYLNHPKLSFNDCCLSVYATLNQAEPLWTFDHALAKSSPTAKLL